MPSKYININHLLGNQGEEEKNKRKVKWRIFVGDLEKRFIYFLCTVCFLVTEWDGDTLEISRISRLDMGAYLCIAANSVPPTVSKRIKVSVDCKYIFLV